MLKHIFLSIFTVHQYLKLFFCGNFVLQLYRQKLSLEAFFLSYNFDHFRLREKL